MKKYQNRQYAVLGLGIFGSTVAKTLSKYNAEVIAVDIDQKCVNRRKFGKCVGTMCSSSVTVH